MCPSSLRPSTVESGLIIPEQGMAGTSHPVVVTSAQKVLHGRRGVSGVNRVIRMLSTQFRLDLDVSDKSASTMVVMFNEPAIELLKCSAYLIVEADDELATSKVVEESACSINADALADVKTKKLKRLATYPAVATPSKPTEDKKKKRVELEDLDDEVTCASRDGPDDANKSSPLDKREKKRYIVDDCNTPNQKNQMLHKRYVNRAKV
nr:hypothetical protein [Tanacetum cinerariifolium]